jgi:outer membrane protein TolC
MALHRREELIQLEHAIAAARHLAGLEGGKYLPTLNGVLDYGFQGETYDFSDENDYWMASLLLQWNLFNGMQDQARREQSEIEIRRIEAYKKEAARQIEIEVRQAVDRLQLELRKSEVAVDRLSSSRQSFKLIDKKFKQGMVAHIAYLDARTRLTEAEINHIITRFDYQIALAAYERITALYTLNETDYK